MQFLFRFGFLLPPPPHPPLLNSVLVYTPTLFNGGPLGDSESRRPPSELTVTGLIHPYIETIYVSIEDEKMVISKKNSTT